MIIVQSTFINLLSGMKQYRIPIYQRNYAWKKEECKRLLEDIVKAGTPGNPNHYIGSIIVKDEPVPGLGGVNIYNIIDGQQRTTTITLLLLALQRYCSHKDVSNIEPMTVAIINAIKDSYLTNKPLNNTELYTKVLPKEGDDRDEYVDLLHDVARNKQISSNYSFFLQELMDKDYDPEVIYNGINNAQLALVTLTSNENPQLLFEAVNDTGVDLTQIDLVRNWIFMGLSAKEQDKLYRKYWKPIESLLKEKLDNLLFYYVRLKSESIVSRNYYSDFKKRFILQTKDSFSIEELLKEIEMYSQLYSDYLGSCFSESKLNGVLNNLKNTEQDIFMPLILKLLYKWQSKDMDLNSLLLCLSYLESYIVRRSILNIPTNSLAPAMVTMLKNSSSLQEYVNCINSLPERQRMPDDRELHTQLSVRDFYHLKGSYNYLFRIEKYLNPAFSLDDPTIEHILPETMHTKAFPKSGVTNADDYNWENDLGPNADSIHDKYQHTLGNLTILPRGENSRMGDYRFYIKKNWNQFSENGFRYGYLHTPIRISQNLMNYDKWDEQTILDRCHEMVDYICKIWPHP